MNKKFPYRKITKAEAIKDYNNLKSLPEMEVINHSSTGNKATDYFFQRERSKTKFKNKISHLKAWKTPKERKKIIEFAKKLRKTDNPKDGDLRSAMQFKYGSINQFRPAVARFIYQQLRPKRVLDFSAGWGGRLLAAMSMDIDYVGIDSNKNLFKPYEKMINLFDSNSHVKLIFQPSETVNFKELGMFDLIFTSPPYFDLEIYPNMIEYGSDENFLNQFFIPVIKKSFKQLKKGGFLVLNMPERLKDALKSLNICKGKINSIEMPIANRFNDGTKRYELIYVCKA